MKSWDAIATQYPCDCACRHIDLVAEVVGSAPMVTTRCKDLFFDLSFRDVRNGLAVQDAFDE